MCTHYRFAKRGKEGEKEENPEEGGERERGRRGRFTTANYPSCRTIEVREREREGDILIFIEHRIET